LAPPQGGALNDIVIFEAESHKVEVRLEGESLWVTQIQMAELFATTSDNVSLHLKNIFQDQELDEKTTTEDFSVVRQEGSRQVKRTLKHYNLDAIISVGYRVNSTQATRFRQWATRILREHLTQGYSLNEHRLARQGLEALAAELKGRGGDEPAGSQYCTVQIISEPVRLSMTIP
jgi:hypothetical protein